MYYRHAVKRIPGAYTHYSFPEWSLVFWDVSFDAIAMTELSHLRVRELAPTIAMLIEVRRSRYDPT